MSINSVKMETKKKKKIKSALASWMQINCFDVKKLINNNNDDNNIIIIITTTTCGYKAQSFLFLKCSLLQRVV